MASATPILIDHTSVELYDKIPAPYMEWIKTKWLTIPGESHSLGYRLGLDLLQQQDARFAVNVLESGTPEGPTSAHMRVSKASWGDVTHATGWRYSYGEEDWFTSPQAITQTLAFLGYANTNGLPVGAVGFGWCWDATWHNSPGGTEAMWKTATTSGSAGALRLGKVLWVMMARRAGWDPDDLLTTRLKTCETPGYFDLLFPAYPGYRHTLQQSTNLQQWTDVPGSEITGSGGEGTYRVDCLGGARIFWKVWSRIP